MSSAHSKKRSTREVDILSPTVSDNALDREETSVVKTDHSSVRLASTLFGRDVSSRMRALCFSVSSREYDKWMRLLDGGRFSTERPGRHSVAGRTAEARSLHRHPGRHCEVFFVRNPHRTCTHSYKCVPPDAGGRSLSQYSQFGRISSAILHCFFQSPVKS
jgi:hypothetical protein